eukprot:scaffold175_cov414-Prasinococcus_capsulatus_cf.AAC.34
MLAWCHTTGVVGEDHGAAPTDWHGPVGCSSQARGPRRRRQHRAGAWVYGGGSVRATGFTSVAPPSTVVTKTSKEHKTQPAPRVPQATTMTRGNQRETDRKRAEHCLAKAYGVIVSLEFCSRRPLVHAPRLAMQRRERAAAPTASRRSSATKGRNRDVGGLWDQALTYIVRLLIPQRQEGLGGEDGQEGRKGSLRQIVRSPTEVPPPVKYLAGEDALSRGSLNAARAPHAFELPRGVRNCWAVAKAMASVVASVKVHPRLSI